MPAAIDPALDKIVRELFGVTSAEMKTGLKPSLQKNNSGGIGVFIEEESDLVDLVGRFLQNKSSRIVVSDICTGRLVSGMYS